MVMGAGRTFVGGSRAVAMLLVMQVPAMAQDYPSRPIRIVVPVPPGGANDTLTRLVVPKLVEGLRQPVIIDNRPGASTTLGTGLVAKASPDGYLLLMAPSAHTVNDTLYGNLPYDSLRDFTPVGGIATTPLLVSVHPSLPVRNVKELVALAQARPNELNFASAGNGTSSHLGGELLKNMTGLKIVHIPYKGGAVSAADVVGGRVLMLFATVQSSINYVTAKKLRALAVTAAQRSSLAQDVPTMNEAGYPGIEVASWYGLVGPAGLSADVMAKLDAEVKRVSHSTQLRDRLLGLGYEPMPMSASEFGAFLKADRARWSKVVREAGIRLEP